MTFAKKSKGFSKPTCSSRREEALTCTAEKLEMKLPLANEAEVPQAKIVLYLLNPEHRAGKGKARFFASHGFAVEGWEKLADALRQHACDHDITKTESTPLGVRFVVERIMTMPDGTVAAVRAVWFIERGERTARFVTAYPLKRKKQV